MGYRHVSGEPDVKFIVCVIGTKNLLEDWKR